MREKEILSQLNKLQNVKPDSAWKESNRELLFSQISNSQEMNVKFSWAQIFRLHMQALTNMSQPAMAVVLISVFFLSGGAFGFRASQDTKPGDSLYIAKKVSEKAQLAFTFDEKKKIKLGLQFAGNRAEEISQVLASRGSVSATADEQHEMDELINNFRDEVTTVKTRTENIRPTVTIVEPIEPKENEGGMIFVATAGKDEKGLQISDNPIGEKDGEEIATTTKEIVEKTTDPQKILKEAGEFLEKEDYNAVILKLEEIIGTDDGKVKGESEEAETATSTEE